MKLKKVLKDKDYWKSFLIASILLILSVPFIMMMQGDKYSVINFLYSLAFCPMGVIGFSFPIMLMSEE